ncbi:hypothetical protein DPMN_038745 [Dreissena polymorpha]|uniref:Uncharacterized protein n=1 Tax=Dreissena polymorpha TaxID=45954 RepID=A0A9D4MG27_DREPO|nr:hypothetical protein DPMN_038745 [Dreissena polymorpha]
MVTCKSPSGSTHTKVARLRQDHVLCSETELKIILVVCETTVEKHLKQANSLN